MGLLTLGGTRKEKGQITFGVRPGSGPQEAPQEGNSAFQREGSESPGLCQEIEPYHLPSGFVQRRNEEGTQKLYPGGANHTVTGSGGQEGPWGRD